MPRSPCNASTLLSTTLVEPVLVSVAEIFWPMLPDLPMPTTTILPRRRSVSTIDFHRAVERIVQLRANLFERGEFDVEDFLGFGEIIHRGENAGSQGFSITNQNPCDGSDRLSSLRSSASLQSSIRNAAKNQLYFSPQFPETSVERTFMEKKSGEIIPTRESLLSRLKDWEDDESWREFFGIYRKLLFSFAVKAGLSEQESEEVVQETIISVAKTIKEFKYDPEALQLQKLAAAPGAKTNRGRLSPARPPTANQEHRAHRHRPHRRHRARAGSERGEPRRALGRGMAKGIAGSRHRARQNRSQQRAIPDVRFLRAEENAGEQSRVGARHQRRANLSRQTQNFPADKKRSRPIGKTDAVTRPRVMNADPPEESPATAPARCSDPGAHAPPADSDYEIGPADRPGGYGDVWLVRDRAGDYFACKVVYRESFENDRPYEREYEGIQKFEPVSQLERKPGQDPPRRPPRRRRIFLLHHGTGG